MAEEMHYSIVEENHHAFAQRTSQSQSVKDGHDQNSSDMARSPGAEGDDGPMLRKAVPAVPTYLNLDYRQALLDLKKRIRVLEEQLASGPNSEDHADSIINASAADTTYDGKVTFESNVKERFEPLHTLPQLQERSWSDFMNKYADEQHDYAVEILIGEPEYHTSKTIVDKPDARQGGSRNLGAEVDTNVQRMSSDGSNDDMPTVPERIRINSPWILQILAAIGKRIDVSGPIVMLRPYKFLIHYENEIRGSIRALEDQLSTSETASSPDQSTDSLPSEPSLHAYEMSTLAQDTESRRHTLQHMRCVTEFLDRYVKPTTNRLQNCLDSKIQFKDLWYIFRPGENIYMPLRLPRGVVAPDAVSITPEIFQGRYTMMWRVICAGGGRPNLADAKSLRGNLKPNPFHVKCYYVDFDGKYFLPTAHVFSIMPFKGERDITALEFYPIRFMNDAQDLVQDHFQKGKMGFDNVNTFRHYYYSGPTLVAQPCGCPVQNDPLHQEHIESEVIVDFRTTLLKHPAWRPKQFVWKEPPMEQRELQEKYPVRYWRDRGRARLEDTKYEYIYDDHYIDRKSAKIFRNSERIFSPVASGSLSNEKMVPEKDVFLMCGRVFAFVLRTRTFAPLWLRLLQPITPQVEGLRNLQLRDDTFKDTIQALVRTHFIQKNLHHTKDHEYDVVRGKGKGLVILLHGAPGVGKTFTAESVAAANGRPLFQITCGDLGLTAGEVGRALKEIFHYAQLWNCVLLLDECDIFLTQRSKNDIQRNSLVSVFLRVLEFYTGVLFLTTNRVGVLDDAIKSRITWIAYYPPLDERQTRNIWKVNLRLLEERNTRLQVDKKAIMNFAREHFTSSPKEFIWNGRQIQNAFKVATALAEWDAYSKDVQHTIDTSVTVEDMRNQPTLRADHFNTIATGTQAFNSYLQEATGYTDAERAFNAMERADEFADEVDIYDSGNVNDVHGLNRNLSPSLLNASTFSRPQRGSISSATILTAPQSYHRDSYPPQVHQTARRRHTSTSQWQTQTQAQPSPSSSIPNLNPPQFKSRRSSVQATPPAPTSASPQLGSQTLRKRGSSYGTGQTPNIPYSAYSPMLNGDKPRRSVDSGLGTREPIEDDDDDDEETDSDLSSVEDEGQGRNDGGKAIPSMGGDTEEGW